MIGTSEGEQYDSPVEQIAGEVRKIGKPNEKVGGALTPDEINAWRMTTRNWEYGMDYSKTIQRPEDVLYTRPPLPEHYGDHPPDFRNAPMSTNIEDRRPWVSSQRDYRTHTDASKLKANPPYSSFSNSKEPFIFRGEAGYDPRYTMPRDYYSRNPAPFKDERPLDTVDLFAGRMREQRYHPDKDKPTDTYYHRIASDEGAPVTINRSHDVPFISGPSNDGKTVYVDKAVPESVTVSGKTFDPAVPLSIHELTEQHVMEELKSRGMTDEKAYEIAHHEFAEPAEDAWYKAHGIDVAAVNKFWAGIDQKTEKEGKGDTAFPKDLYTAPYPHNEVEGVKHEPSGVAAEWPVGKDMGKFQLAMHGKLPGMDVSAVPEAPGESMGGGAGPVGRRFPFVPPLKEVDMDKVRSLVAEGKSLTKISKELGVSKDLISRRLQGTGLTPNNATVWTPDMDVKLNKTIDEGLNEYEASSKLGVSRELYRYHKNKIMEEELRQERLDELSKQFKR